MLTTDQELLLLEADDLGTGARVRTAHFFTHFGSSATQRSEFCGDLREAGFGTIEIGSDEQDTGNGYWHHWAFTVFDAVPDVLRDADQRAREIADSHGANYNGWEVQRLGRSEGGRARLADDEYA